MYLALSFNSWLILTLEFFSLLPAQKLPGSKDFPVPTLSSVRCCTRVNPRNTIFISK